MVAKTPVFIYNSFHCGPVLGQFGKLISFSLCKTVKLLPLSGKERVLVSDWTREFDWVRLCRVAP